MILNAIPLWIGLTVVGGLFTLWVYDKVSEWRKKKNGQQIEN